MSENVLIDKAAISENELNFFMSGYGEFLIPFSISSFNDEYIFKYYLEDYVMFENLEYPTKEELYNVLIEILKSIENGNEFIFNIEKMILNENSIFLNRKSKKIAFKLIIGKRESLSEKIISILEYMEKNTSLENKKIVKRIKRDIAVYNLSVTGLLQEIKKMLRD